MKVVLLLSVASLASAGIIDMLGLGSVVGSSEVGEGVDIGNSEFGLEEVLEFAQRLLGYKDDDRGLVGLARPFDPVLDLDPVDLIKLWGYPAERHYVTTDDGYVLGVWRIPGGFNSSSDGSVRPVVLLGHGILLSAADWIIEGPGKSVAFRLADEGYDVWMLNFRGNTYSKNHTTLSPDDLEFWDFTLHEHGIYDLPATIEYIISHTGEDQMHYVGFSMGGGVPFVTDDLRPDATQHIKLFTALAPAAEISNLKGPIFRVVLPAGKVAALPEQLTGTSIVGSREILPSTLVGKKAGEALCAEGAPTQPLCTALFYLLSGANDKQENKPLYPTILSRFPAGTSLKNVAHYGQILYKGFRQYDYGFLENLKRYGRLSPPAYDVESFSVPVRVHYGEGDFLVVPKDAQKLCRRIPSKRLLSCEAESDPEWTHGNYLWAKDLSVAYGKIITDIKAFDANHS